MKRFIEKITSDEFLFEEFLPTCCTLMFIGLIVAAIFGIMYLGSILL